MFVLVYSEGNSLSTDNECRAYDSAEKAHAVMLGQLERILADDDYSISRKVECAPGRYDLYGDWAGEGGGKVYLGFLNDFDAYLEDGEHRWVIFEVPDSPAPKRNPNAAKTVRYECGGDPEFRSSEVLLHQATVRWNSGKSFECHAPERVELRIGGTAYEYKAI